MPDSVGRRARFLALPLLIAVGTKFAPGPDGNMTVAIDDSPMGRYGRHVEGAGVHHNPTAGPADGCTATQLGVAVFPGDAFAVGSHRIAVAIDVV